TGGSKVLTALSAATSTRPTTAPTACSRRNCASASTSGSSGTGHLPGSGGHARFRVSCPRLPVGTDTSGAATQQVDVHDPALRGTQPRPRRHDALAHRTDRTGDQGLVGHAEIGAPPDVGVVGDAGEGAVAVQHDHRRTWPESLLADLAPGGDVHRLA